MEAQYQRQIKSGYQYDNLFPKSDGEYSIVNINGTVKQDTIPLMVKTAKTHAKDTQKLAPYLKGDTLEDTCRNVWNFIYHHIQYKLDTPGTEEIRTPARTWHDRKTGVDCDCYSTFASSILLNLSIPHKFRVTKYAGNWQHVYVVVPNANGGYYTIDPVLDTFNYEKPFTDNIDKPMHTPTLNGMPLALLSGYGNDDNTANQAALLGYINGEHMDTMFDEDSLEGPGDIEDAGQKALDAIYKHLVATRDFIVLNPASVITQGGAPNNLEMLNYAIDKWNTPERDAALDLLERKENEWAAATGRSQDVSGLGKGALKKFFGGVKAATKTVTNTVKTVASDIKRGDIKQAIKDTGRGIKTTVKETVKAAGGLIKSAVKGIIRFNPISLAMRGGFLLALRVNLFHIASKLAPGYSGDAKAKSAIEKIEKLFVDKLQGKPEALKKAITKGAARGLSGLGVEPVTTSAGIIAAITPIATALIASKKSGLDVPEAGDAEGAENEGEKKQGFIKKVVSWIKGKFSKGSLSPTDTSTDVANELAEESAGGEGGEGGSEVEYETNADGTPKLDESGNPIAKSKGVIGWVKKHPVATGGIVLGTAAVVTGVVILIKRSKKKKQSVSGLAGHKKAPQKLGHKKIKKLQLS